MLISDYFFQGDLTDFSSEEIGWGQRRGLFGKERVVNNLRRSLSNNYFHCNLSSLFL